VVAVAPSGWWSVVKSPRKGTVGTRLFNKESIAEVSLADFIGTFTDIQFRKKSNTPSKKR
jgi:hypothetical protein